MLKSIGAEVQRAEVLNYKVKEGQKMRGANVKYKRGAEMQRCSFRGAGGKGCRGAEVQRCLSTSMTELSAMVEMSPSSRSLFAIFLSTLRMILPDLEM